MRVSDRMVRGAHGRKKIRIGPPGELRNRVATHGEKRERTRQLVPQALELQSCGDVAAPDELRRHIPDERERRGVRPVGRRSTEALEIRQHSPDAFGIEAAATDNRRHRVSCVDRAIPAEIPRFTNVPPV